MKSTQKAELSKFARDESSREDCFLCRPSAQLLAHVGGECYTMAGLGPVCDCYALVATYQHGRIQTPDNPVLLKTIAEYCEISQRILSEKFGSCVLAEHGKIPVCNPNRPAGSHCFHPHFLLFPGAPDPLPEFEDYFSSKGDRFKSLTEAVRHAARLPSYLLGSSRPGQYTVFPIENGLPRQFARLVVADSLGLPELASWLTHPNGEWATRNAEVLRKLLASHKLSRKLR